MSVERRQLSDRRGKPTPLFSKYSIIGRRRGARRKGEDCSTYVDRYELRFLLMIAAILVLCFMDAYLTLTLIRYGGLELNPFMLILMNKDVVLALVLKYVVTVLCLVFFLVHKNFRIFGRVRIQVLIYSVLFLYVTLVAMECYWYFQVSRILEAFP